MQSPGELRNLQSGGHINWREKAVCDLPSPLPPLFYMQSLVESPSGDALSTLNSVISMGLFYP